MTSYGPPPPYPQHPYGSATPYVDRRPLDAVSIAALVCGLTCCAGPVGIGLGIAGLVRTGGGRRRGRWAAVTGLVVGSVATVAMAAVIAFVVVTTIDDLDPADARAGQCVDFDWLDYPEATPCGEPHDAEIVWVARMDDDLMREWDDAEDVATFCLGRPLSAEATRTIENSDDYATEYWVDTFSGEPEPGEWMMCLVTAADGQQLGPR